MDFRLFFFSFGVPASILNSFSFAAEWSQGLRTQSDDQGDFLN